MDMLDQLLTELRAKWRAYAYDQVVKDGRLFYFVISSSCNDWVVLPAWGEDAHDARRRLESSLRLLGAQKLMELECGPIPGRLALPVCSDHDTAEIMLPDGAWLWGRLALWRCGRRGCARRSWTLAGKIQPPVRPLLAGNNSPFDIDV